MSLYINGLQVARVGVSAAGGVITGHGAPTVTFLGSKVSLDGDAVAAHGIAPHAYNSHYWRYFSNSLDRSCNVRSYSYWIIKGELKWQ
jgi:uncharacterized Zn-binding protein involved in type VI secretion